MKETKIVNVSDFFENEVSPLVLGAFFSRYVFTNDNKYIIATSFFKKSAKVNVDSINYEAYKDIYLHILNDESSPDSNWINKNSVPTHIKVPLGQAFYILNNDININKDSFYNRLYSKLLGSCEWLYDESLTEKKKKFIRGYMELRGSIDTTANYIAQDYFYSSQFEIKKARLLVDYLSIPYYLVNINFRELQEQYYTNVRQRNTQLRLDLFWYMENIGLMNAYKSEIFRISRSLEGNNPVHNITYYNGFNINHRKSNIFDSRLNYYCTNIFGNLVQECDIKKMRSELGLESMNKSIRNYALVELIRYMTPDECACCKNKYDIKDRTFVNKRTGRPYFEIHHVISLGDNRELDDENNLVKLCPICHKTLKKGIGTEFEQKVLIKDILLNSPNILEFAQHFFDTNDFNKIIHLIYINLK